VESHDSPSSVATRRESADLLTASNENSVLSTRPRSARASTEPHLPTEPGELEHALGGEVPDVHVDGDPLDTERELVVSEQRRDARPKTTSAGGWRLES
jgi:hypothetical protein